MTKQELQEIKARYKDRKHRNRCGYTFCQRADEDIPALVAEIDRLREWLDELGCPVK